MPQLPVLTSLHGYQRAWVANDVAAGLTLLAIAVPEQLATTRLAGMPPITGFYAFVAGTLLFALLGSSPQVSVGADSTIAPLFAAGVSALALSGSVRYVSLVAILAVLAGLIVVLVGLLHLGWVAEFLSAPIVAGFLSGVAVIIVVHQLPDLLGLAPPVGTNQHRFVYVCTHLGEVHGGTLALGLGVFAVMALCARVDRRIPGALVGMVGATVCVAAFDLQAKGVAVLGTVRTGSVHVGLTGVTWSTLGKLVPLAAVVALVVVTQTAATTRAFAEQGGYDIDAGRDFLGVGAGSVLAGLVGSFPVNASPPRTGAVATTGGRTQAAALGAAIGVVILIPVANILRDVPVSALAAVLIFIALRLFDVKGLVAIARFNWLEFGLAAVTLVTVVLVGVEQGIAVAVLLALLDRIRISARPQVHVLGRIQGTTSWARPDFEPLAAPVDGAVVAMFATPIWYANAIRFRDEVAEVMRDAPGPVRVFVLDTIGMSDIDYTGTRALSRVLDACQRNGVTVGVARAGIHLRDSLRRSGLADRIGEDHFFDTVDGAVRGLLEGPAS